MFYRLDHSSIESSVIIALHWLPSRARFVNVKVIKFQLHFVQVNARAMMPGGHTSDHPRSLHGIDNDLAIKHDPNSMHSFQTSKKMCCN
jgi:hypothetical protein